MAKQYTWSINPLKLQRAIVQARKEQQPEAKMDERVKEIYISFGGKVIEVAPVKKTKKDIELEEDEEENDQ